MTGQRDVRSRLRRAASAALDLPLRSVFLVLAAMEGRRARRRPPGAPPRVFLGTAPIITIKTLKQAAEASGMVATTVVREVYSIHRRTDFDLVTDDFVPRALHRLPEPVRVVVGDLLTFAWAIRNFDVFFFYVDGRVLVRTPLRWSEFDLLRRAGKRTVVTCYGGDVQVPDRIADPVFLGRLLQDYPAVAARADWVRRLTADAIAGADVIVGGVEWVDYLDRWDAVIAAPYFLDVDDWTRPVAPADAPERPGPFRVFHAANHPNVKGTDLLVAAVDALRAEGLDIELDLVTGVPNDVVKEKMTTADVVADQFVIGWYGLQAVEGMSLERPVLAYLRPDLVDLYAAESFAGACPIVATTADEIGAHLRALAGDPERCAELGRAGRSYVTRFHSPAYAAIALRTWIALAEERASTRSLGPNTARRGSG